MKIIKEGKLPSPPQTWWNNVLFVCPNCGVEFILNGDDEGRIGLSNYPRTGEIGLDIRCPTKDCFEDGTKFQRTLKKMFRGPNLKLEIK